MAKKFYIYPDPDNDYWKCEVSLVKSTKSITKEYNTRHPGNDVQIGGLFQSMRVWWFKTKKQAETLKGGKPTGIFGKITLARDQLDVETITHECAHAAHEYCRRRRKSNFKPKKSDKLIGTNEETYCYALGYMADQVLTKFLKTGFRLKVAK